jgi:hypothetical protein
VSASEWVNRLATFDTHCRGRSSVITGSHRELPVAHRVHESLPSLLRVWVDASCARASPGTYVPMADTHSAQALSLAGGVRGMRARARARHARFPGVSLANHTTFPKPRAHVRFMPGALPSTGPADRLPVFLRGERMGGYRNRQNPDAPRGSPGLRGGGMRVRNYRASPYASRHRARQAGVYQSRR